MTSAKSCSWYGEKKLRDLGVNDMEDEALSILIEPGLRVERHVEDHGWQEYDPQDDPDIDMEFGPYGEELQFLPVELKGNLDEHESQTSEKIIFLETTHGRHAVLDDDDDDKQITIVDEDAGMIFHMEAPPRLTQVDQEGDTFMEEGGEPNQFSPFSSELDWRVAH